MERRAIRDACKSRGWTDPAITYVVVRKKLKPLTNPLIPDAFPFQYTKVVLSSQGTPSRYEYLCTVMQDGMNLRGKNLEDLASQYLSHRYRYPPFV
jgi:hypothetical protein